MSIKRKICPTCGSHRRKGHERRAMSGESDCKPYHTVRTYQWKMTQFDVRKGFKKRRVSGMVAVSPQIPRPKKSA
jgi:hypothetical protein